MGIEKYVSHFDQYVSAGKRVVAAASLSTLVSLSACEAAWDIFQAQMELTAELGKMSYRIAKLPFSDLPWLKDEPSVNRCVETPEEKVCKIYLKEKTDTDPDVYEEYFGVLKIRKEENPQEKLVKLIFGYYEGDKYDLDGKKKLTIVMYTGRDSEEFSVPTFGNVDFPYNSFKTYFDSPRIEILDTRENPLSIAKKEDLLTLEQRTVFLKLLSGTIGYASKLADEQLPKIKE